MPKIAETCQVFKMIEASEVLDLGGVLFSSWNLETMDCDNDESVLSMEYTDSEGLVFEYFFTKKACLEASFEDNVITMIDDTDEKVEIACYSLAPIIL